jgi:hypothetical protein
MELKTIQPLLEDKVKWDLLVKHLQELRQQIIQELEVATSEQAMFRCQGKLVMLKQLLTLDNALKQSQKDRLKYVSNTKQSNMGSE